MADKQAKKDWDNYKVYRDDSQDWRIERDKNEKFYFGDQWSQSTSRKLENRGQVDIVVNKIRALLRTRVSMMIANKPTGRVFGVKKGDINAATLMEEFADWHLYNSDWQFHLERVVMGQNRCGIHWLTLYDDPTADYNRGELKVGNESFRYVFCDKAAGTRWDFSDAARVIDTKQRRPEDWWNSLPPKIRKTISLEQLKSLTVPDDELRWSGEHQHRGSNPVGTPVSVSTTEEKRDVGEWIREMDVYEKVMVDVPVLKDAQGIIFMVGDPDGDWNEDQKKAIEEGVLEEAEVAQNRIKFHKSISGKMVLPLDGNNLSKKADILPIEDYPLIPIIDEDTGNALPLGEIDFQSGIQEVLNAAVSLTLLNASLASNMKILVDAGKAGITDIETWQNQWAIPGVALNVKTDPVTGKFPVEIIRPEPLTQAWFNLMQIFSQEIEFQISTFSLRTGDPAAAPDTFAATLQLGQWAQDILRIPLNRLELGLERLYNLIFAWSPNYYDFEKIFFTFGKDGEPIWQTINFQTMESIKARYRIRAGSTLPSQTVSELGVMQNLAQLEPALIGSVVDRMPGLKDSDKAEIKQTIDIVNQLRQADAQKGEVINLLQQQMQHLQEQNFALQREQALNPLKREVDKTIAQIKANRKEFEKLDGDKKSKR